MIFIDEVPFVSFVRIETREIMAPELSPTQIIELAERVEQMAVTMEKMEHLLCWIGGSWAVVMFLAGCLMYSRAFSLR